MRRVPAFLFALLLLCCSRPGTQGQIATMGFVPSRQRVFAQSDSEPVVTAWLSLGSSFASVKGSILYGLLLSDSPALDASHKPAGAKLRRGRRVTVAEATPWESTGREYKRWYKVMQEGSAGKVWVDSADVALITAEKSSLRAGFLERKIAVAGGESEYNVLVLCTGTNVCLIDSSALVFADSFHPSGVTSIELEDVNSDGTLKALVQGQTIVSLQFLGASPLSWEAWLKETDDSWGAIFRFNVSYGTDQGNSYTASRRAFSSTRGSFLDTIKVTTNLQETTSRGVFHTTIETFFRWNGSIYKEDPGSELPEQATLSAATSELRALPQPDSAVVEALHRGDTLFIFDRGDTEASVAGQRGFWLHATTKTDKDGWIHSSVVKPMKIDPLKVNRDIFLGKPGVVEPVDQPASP